MEQLELKICKYIKSQPEIKIVQNKYNYEIVDAQTSEWYGTVDFFENGSISSLDLELWMLGEDCEPVERSEETSTQIDGMIGKAEQFIKDFVPKKVEFSMLVEWDESDYMIIYEENDDKLNLPIPHTGCTIYMNANGEIKSANIGIPSYTLTYPQVTVKKEEAKELLRNEQLIQLHLQVEDDGQVELIYRATPEITGVKVDGEVDNVYEFMGVNELRMHTIAPVTPEKSVEQLLGLYENLIRYKDDGESQLWVETDHLNTKQEDTELEPVVSIVNNETGHFSSSSSPWVKQENKLSINQLQEQALQYLEQVVGTIHEKYLLEEPTIIEEEIDEQLEELYVEGDNATPNLYEPTQMFTFIRQHRGMKIEGFNAYIHVGIYSGLIRECSTSFINETRLQSMDLTPKLSIVEAQKLYFKEMDLKLAWSIKEFDEPSIYDLAYLINFPGENGAIATINAHTGKITYIDTGILREKNDRSPL
ncbi:hypothetical protein [Alkalihalobacterium elongatum]|uniref:hypothetical protein n=1 Tax=Alkalihalobacterium elongatum TaxID=2675466 RepID=UPI001C1F5B36|nr:hypothetical protein [Alkalihalobacterium elongatum]